jgi:hypothetical protein
MLDRWRANWVFIWREVLTPLVPPIVYIGIGATLSTLVWRLIVFLQGEWRERATRRQYKKQEKEAERRWRHHKRERRWPRPPNKGKQDAEQESSSVAQPGERPSIEPAPASVSMPDRWRRWRRYLRATADERALLVACLNDREAAARLIEFEFNSDPSITWDCAVKAALARIRHDNA